MGASFEDIIAAAMLAVAIGLAVLVTLVFLRLKEALQLLRDMRTELTRMRKYYEPDTPQPTQVMER